MDRPEARTAESRDTACLARMVSETAALMGVYGTAWEYRQGTQM